MFRITRARKRVAVVTSIAAAALLLSACSGGGPKPNQTGDPNGHISYWYSLSDNSAERKAAWTKYNVTAFQDQYPGVTVDGVNKSGETIDQNIQVALAAGKGPDLIQTPGSSNAAPYADAGYLADLSDQFEASGWGDKLLPWAAQSGEFQGKFMFIPQYYETLVLYYNKTLFDEHGWSIPTNREEFESLATEIEDAGITPIAAGNADYQPSTGWLVSMFLDSVAGPDKVYQAINGDIPWTDPAFKESIDLLNEYFQKGWFGGGVKPYFTTGDAKKYAELADGDAAMYISGSWETGTLDDYFGVDGNTAEWDWAPFPSLSDGVPQNYPLSVGGTLSINSKTENPLAATAYLDWLMTDTKTMWEQAAETGMEPLPVHFEPSDVPESIDSRYARMYITLQDAPDVGYTSWTSFGGSADTYISAGIDKVLTGDLSTDDFLKELDAAFQEDFTRDLVPVPFSPTN
jgi:raffinose/stachyose/melibiose transport system substrate-binding protein